MEGQNGMSDEKEAQANSSSNRSCCHGGPSACLYSGEAKARPLFSDFLRAFGIATGIVVGQLQYKGLLLNTHCNDLKVRYQWSHD